MSQTPAPPDLGVFLLKMYAKSMIYWGTLLECTKEGVTMPAHEKRVLSLDGLRGLGALMVFLYHVDIMVKPFGAGGPSLFPGTASVMVFFILSGIVLSLVPFKHMGNGGYDWLGYYPRRVVRLCVPLFAAIALALPAGYVAWRLGSNVALCACRRLRRGPSHCGS